MADICTEFSARIYDSMPLHYHWEVMPDPDGCGVRIAYREEGGTDAVMSASKEVAVAIANAIHRIIQLNPDV
jgi:hypothetical protein